LLILAAAQTFYSVRSAKHHDENAPTNPPFLWSLVTGGGIGFVSGVTGVGGGIFLAPFVLALGWVETRRAAAVSAAFNLLNSAAALAVHGRQQPLYPASFQYGSSPWRSALRSGLG
jgi:uncharacterized membrane protein YfcA